MRTRHPSIMKVCLTLLAASAAFACSSSDGGSAASDAGLAGDGQGSGGISGGDSGAGGAGGHTGGAGTGGASPGDAGTGGAVHTGGTSSGGAPEAGAGGSDAGSGDGAVCHDVEVGGFCVRGTPGASGETLAAGEPLQIQVIPKGCWSSSCTRVDVATCSVTGSGPFVAEGHFCLASTAMPGQGCTADCGGGGFARCQSSAMLSSGQETVQLGGFTVTVTVPSTLPFGGACDGNPF